MFTRKLAVTLIFPIAVLLVLAGPSSANGILPGSVHRRDHVNLKRMIKMRAPAHLDVRQRLSDGLGAIGAADDPPVGSSSTSSTPSPSPSPTPSGVPRVPTDSIPLVTSISSSSFSSSSSTSSSSPTSTSSSTSSTSSTTPSSTSTSSSSSTSTSSTSSSTPVSTPNTKPSTTPSNQQASVDSVTLTSHIPAASSPAAKDNSQIGGSSMSRTTITILIVLAASIGGCAIIWTIIRKWKFRPSAEFGDRLEPINWQPTEHDSGLPTVRRVPSNASSFHSAGHEHGSGSLSHSDSHNGAAYNAPVRTLTPLPEHDFTAGPATLAPGGGYADLARGPSPQPQMQEGAQRGLSLNRGYDPFSGVPLHHQGGYTAQDAYDYNNAGARY